jgi:hypothetical protein
VLFGVYFCLGSAVAVAPGNELNERFCILFVNSLLGSVYYHHISKRYLMSHLHVIHT